LEGDPPTPLNPPSGCTFHPRCPYADVICAQSVPQLEAQTGQREVACLRLDAIPETDLLQE